jgi:hypothetical protein
VRAEYNAFVARLRAHTQLANKTDTVVRFNTDGTAVRANYVVAFPAVPHELRDRRFTAEQKLDSDRYLSFDVRVVAVDSDGLMLLVEAVMAQLVNHALTVSGRRCDPIVMATDGVEEGRVDYDRTSRLFFVDLTFEFWSRRA